MSSRPPDSRSSGQIFKNEYLKEHETPRDIENLVQEMFNAERRLDEERDKRRKDWSDTNKLALVVGITIIGFVIFFVVGGLWHTNARIDSLLAELREKGERISKLEAQLPYSPFD